MKTSGNLACTLRPAMYGDVHMVWQWRNDPAARAASFTTAEIPYADHEAWFVKSLDQTQRRIWMVQHHGMIVGTVRVDLWPPLGLVSLVLAPEMRGRGLASPALRALDGVASELPDVRLLVALIKAPHPRSHGAFVSAGYHVAATIPGLTVLTKEVVP